MPSSAHPPSTSPAPKPSLPSPAKEKPAPARASPPREQSHDDAENDSEAETEVLSDHGIKSEDEDVGERPADSAAATKDTNGAKHGREHDGKSSAPLSPTSRRTSRQEQNKGPGEVLSPALAASSPAQPVTTRGRSLSAVESRKRKLRDDCSPKPVEPVRQKPKIDGPRNQPPSPAPSATHPHKRSASTQSILQGAQGRKRRELSTIVLPSQERKTWSDSSSETSSSPRPVLTPSLPHARVKRSSHRALTSPARAMMPKKNVDRFGATRLARECEKGDLELVQAAFSAAPEELNQEDFAGIAPLQKASLNGHAEIVEFLLNQGCRTDCESNDRDTPLIDAVENGHLDVVKLLLTKAKVNPHHQNKKGQRAIDVLNDDEDDMKEIEAELKQAMRRETNTLEDADTTTETNQQRTTSRLLYNEFNTETLIEKAGEGDILAVGELLNSNIKPNIACGVAAARGGHYDILSILLASGLKADPDPSKHSETPMLVTIGRGHLKIIKLILEQDSFDPTKRNREGRTYFEISEERRGPKWEQERELLKAAYDKHRGEHKSPKRNRKEAHNAASTRPKRKSSPRRERSSSPRQETRRIQLTKSSTAPGGPQKTRGRLISGRELSNQRDAKKRRRAVVDDETASSESDQSPKPTGKSAAKRKSFSDDEQKPQRKSVKSRFERRNSRARSEDSEEDTRKHIKKLITKPRASDREKTRDLKPTPDAESPDDKKANRKLMTKARNLDRDKSKDMKSTFDDKHKDDIKARRASTPAADAKKTTALPEKATTPESVLESRRQEAERQAEEAKRKAAEEEARKAEEAEAARKAAEEETAKRIAEAEAEAKRIADEAEAKRIADEAARVAAEKEARRVAEEEAKQVARLQRLSKLPRVLRRAAELGSKRPLHFSGDEMGISASFLPLYKVALQDIDPSVQTDDPWIMSFQAVGILGLPELDLAYLGPPYSNWTRKEVTSQQRKRFLRNYDIALLAQDFRFPMEGDDEFDFDKIQQCIKETAQQFLDMEGLYWIPLESFAMVAKEDPALKDLMGSICSSKARPAHIKDGEVTDKRLSFLDAFMDKRGNGVEVG